MQALGFCYADPKGRVRRDDNCPILAKVFFTKYADRFFSLHLLSQLRLLPLQGPKKLLSTQPINRRTSSSSSCMLAVRISSAVNLIEERQPKQKWKAERVLGLLRQHFYKTSSKRQSTPEGKKDVKLPYSEIGIQILPAMITGELKECYFSYMLNTCKSNEEKRRRKCRPFESNVDFDTRLDNSRMNEIWNPW
ncbi:alpha/beta-Hydrolases superfamily protein [Striga asiatica]|uniref:Alpha/beta-Hydrolases superfamily protein n=1 Tax=Striga asiatica TaxID=4170 RepID=A0A5A7Q2S3_STRAF|nr:alpha/beta-Hydrolases superfamily protein [Striga asiatica]